MTEQVPAPLPGPSVPPELEAVVEAGARAAHGVSGAVALGGTVCSLYAHHRLSIDIDFVVRDLRDRFDEIREHLLSLPGWREARTKRPVLILGSLDRTEIGYRQQRRPTPIETVSLRTQSGVLIIPTFEEILRIKAVLAYERNATRDYEDVAELASLVQEEEAIRILADIDRWFAWDKQPTLVLEVAKALMLCEPVDTPSDEFPSLRLLRPRFTSWLDVRAFCQNIGKRLSIELLGS